jgi:hypothetical protein
MGQFISKFQALFRHWILTIVFYNLYLPSILCPINNFFVSLIKPSFFGPEKGKISGYWWVLWRDIVLWTITWKPWGLQTHPHAPNTLKRIERWNTLFVDARTSLGLDVEHWVISNYAAKSWFPPT